jgi:hypothetical protein
MNQDVVEYAAAESTRLWRAAEDQRLALAAEVVDLRAANANLRLQNAKLKYWLHQAGICPVTGEEIEGCDG